MLVKASLWASMVSGAAMIVVHLLTFLPEPPRVSHLAVFPFIILLFPSFALSVRLVKEGNKDMDPRHFWKRAFESAPSWVGPGILVLLAYTGFNFFFSLLALNEGLSPAEVDGQFVLQNHGRVVRNLTEAEYLQHKGYELRGMSTHIVFFHAVSAAILWAELRRRASSSHEPAPPSDRRKGTSAGACAK